MSIFLKLRWMCCLYTFSPSHKTTAESSPTNVFPRLEDYISFEADTTSVTVSRARMICLRPLQRLSDQTVTSAVGQNCRVRGTSVRARLGYTQTQFGSVNIPTVRNKQMAVF